MDLKIDRDGSRDLVFTNGVCPTTTDFTDSTAQRVFIMLRTFQGEWYLDESAGIPYFQRIFGKRSDKGSIDRILQQKILEVEGVADILEFRSELKSNREYEATFKVRDTQSGVFTQTTDFPIS